MTEPQATAVTEPELTAGLEPEAKTEIAPQLHWTGERGHKLQMIGDHFAAHAGEPLTVKAVSEELGTTAALVAVFIDRHAGDFNGIKEGRATRYSYRGELMTRTERCEHERARKVKKGTCIVCGPVAS